LVSKESISFLKKRNKKLLSLFRWYIGIVVAGVLALTDKSFLVLFFKKELSSYLGRSLKMMEKA